MTLLVPQVIMTLQSDTTSTTVTHNDEFNPFICKVVNDPSSRYKKLEIRKIITKLHVSDAD